jgi:glycosyltransferase involved in cell wall biosynthesis
MSKNGIRVSVVLPCLNEAATITACVEAARKTLDTAGIAGEVVVADNGSADASRELAARAGARVVEVTHRGYGNVLREGMRQAEGGLLIFMDADMSYDFDEIPCFIEKLEAGADVVIGSRLRGVIDKGAMPRSHQIIGTPAMTFIANMLFRLGISDINCGMRGLSRDAFERLDLHSEGMEFASEMMIRAAREKMCVAEIPIAFHADQRGHEPHLRSFRDGWRHMQLMLHYCPLWLFFLPGIALYGGGVFFLWALLQRWHNPQAGFLIHYSAFSMTVSGTCIILLGLIAQGRVNRPRLLEYDTVLVRLMRRWVRIEKGIFLGFLMSAAGFLFMFTPYLDRIPGPFNALHVFLLMVAATLMINGIIIFFVSLFIGLFGMRVADDAAEYEKKYRP